MTGAGAFQPLLPVPALAALAVLALVAVGLALARGLSGWAWRGLALAAALLALSGPLLRDETRRPLGDILVMIEDRTASNRLAGRGAQAQAAADRIAAAAAAMPGLTLRRIALTDAPDDGGTRLGRAIAEAVAAEPAARLAGVVVLSDGQAHDAALAPGDLPAPLHLLLTGRPEDRDRRLVVETAPPYALIGEAATIRLRVDDSGAVPPESGAGALVDLTLSVDGGAAVTHRIPVGQTLELPFTPDHAGPNVVQLAVAGLMGEVTAANNSAVIEVNGLRDRLRVLLVSGQPHAGERTWRNLLKSDPAVELVHFTILRPPEKTDGVPVDELALIPFPTEDLFAEKIGRFDLIVFDRYAERGLLKPEYLGNIRRHVEAGGAVLVAAGPEFAGPESLARSALGPVLPAQPTWRVIEQPFLPRPSPEGLRHPVTAGLTGAPGDDPAAPHWGRWLRQIELRPTAGATVLTGAEGAPLLQLARVGQGRVALLASDHAWLWARGYDGGGPQLELLRRIAHWSMKEPDLDEESLSASVRPGAREIEVTRRSMAASAGPVAVSGPDGAVVSLPLAETAPGRFAARWTAPVEGLYRLAEGDLTRAIVVGPANPRELTAPLADPAPLAPAVAASGGGVLRLAEGIPDLRMVPAGRALSGRGWIGITPRGAAAVTGIRQTPVLPAWAWLALVAGLAVLAWLVEGRGRRSP